MCDSDQRSRFWHAILFGALALVGGMLGAMLVQSPTVAYADPQENSTALSRLKLRFAEVDLEEARTVLQHARDTNRRAPGTYSAVLLEKLRLRASVLEETARNLRDGKVSDMHSVFVRKAEGEVKLAELKLRNLHDFHATLSPETRKFELRRAELLTERARLALEIARHPDMRTSPMKQLAWKLSRLQEDVLDLRIRLQVR